MKKIILSIGLVLIYILPSLSQQKNWLKYSEYPGIYTLISEYKSFYDSTNYTQILIQNRYNNFIHLKINMKNNSIEKDTIVSLYSKKIGLLNFSNTGISNNSVELKVTELWCEGTNLSFLLPKGLPENEVYIYEDNLQPRTVVKVAPEYIFYKMKNSEINQNE
jgi:hypothetical protein